MFGHVILTYELKREHQLGISLVLIQKVVALEQSEDFFTITNIAGDFLQVLLNETPRRVDISVDC